MHTHQNGQKIQLLLFLQLYALRQHCNDVSIARLLQACLTTSRGSCCSSYS